MTRSIPRFLSVLCLLFLAMVVGARAAETPFQFNLIQPLTNREAVLKLSAPGGLNYRLETSTNLTDWHGLMTFTNPVSGAGLILQTDSAAPFLPDRFYRARQLAEANALTGDHLATDDGEVVIHAVNHASFVLGWKGLTIYNDPVGGAARYQGVPKADLILVSHAHGDHFDNATLTAVARPGAIVVAPKSVYQSLPTALKAVAILLANGASTNALGMPIEAVAMYNTTAGRLTNHPKGDGNGYVLTLGGRRLYMAGDTEDIPEMRALQNIDAAFVCMNLPYTMTVQQAASAVRAFRPKVVYPYHYQGSDVALFKKLVGADLGIEVRLRKWY